MRQTLLLLIVLALICIPSALALDANISRPDKTYYLERNSTANDVIKVTNTTDNRTCYTVTTLTNNEELRATPATDHFCLNGHETTEITITLATTQNISDGSVNATATFYSATDQNTVTIPIQIGGTAPLAFDAQNKTICQEYNEFDIGFTNNSGGVTPFTVNASSESLLPVFRNQQMQIAGGTQTNRLRVNANSNTVQGDYNYSIRAETDHAIIIKKGTISVRNCDATGIVDFVINENDVCPTLSPGQNRTIDVRLENHTDQSLDLDLDVQNDRFSLSLNDTHVTLSKNEIRNIPIVVRAPSSIQAGNYFLEFSAKNGSFKQTVGVCVNVTGAAALRLLQNNFTVQRGETISAQLDVKNTSDRFQDVFMEFAGLGSGFEGSFSSSDFGLNGGYTRTLLVKINIKPNALLGPQSIMIRAKTNNGTASVPLNLNVVSAGPNGDQNQTVAKYLQIMSYPSTIDLNAGDIKRLYFTIQNTYRDPLTNITLELQNLPGYLTFEPLTDIYIDKNGTIQLTGVLRVAENAPNAITKPVLFAQNAYYYAATGIEITTHGPGTSTTRTTPTTITAPKNPIETQFIGFVGFAGQNTGLVGL
ncbi:MAG: hypothetical protein Q7R47_01535, partial [Candidatus Diapherotrites archaeon]|nr:hypothetical protein [Candidatus Diapherotrites archaeon]